MIRVAIILLCILFSSFCFGADRLSAEKMDSMIKSYKQNKEYDKIYHLSQVYLEGSDWLSKDIKKGVDLLRYAAEKDYPKAQYFLALISYKGLYVKKDYKKAHYWLKRAADNGYDEAILLYAHDLARGELTGKKDIQKALRLIRFLAEKNHSEAQLNLYATYYQGKLLEKDYGKAYYWLKRSVDNGNDEAIMIYAQDLTLGTLTGKKDIQKAEKLFNQQAEKGNTEAYFFLAMLYFIDYKDYDNALKYALLTIEDGNFKLFSILNTIYNTGGNSFKKDKLKAAAYAIMAIWHGNILNDDDIASIYNKIYENESKDFIIKAEDLARKMMQKLNVSYDKQYLHKQK